MPYSHIKGNEQAKKYLTKITEKGMVGHSFLFGGPSGAGKRQFARAFAAEIIGGEHTHKVASGNHPDVHVLRPEGKASLHSPDSLRQMIAEVYLPPNEGLRKLFIIEQAERMYPVSANALLKTFEEPSPDTVIILITDHPAMILPTILSRCRKITFSAEENDQINPQLLELLATGASCRYGDLQKITRALQEEIEEAQEALVHERQKVLKERDLSAIQRGALEKEIEGEATSFLHHQAEDLFTMLFKWYRDRHLMRMGGDKQYLFHKEEEKRLLALQQVYLPSLGSVQKAIEEAKLAVQRSQPLATALETLFLKLTLA